MRIEEFNNSRKSDKVLKSENERERVLWDKKSKVKRSHGSSFKF